MASVKAIAAIALTLIIAVPIMLGYAFASDEETYTEWESASSENVSPLLLNATTSINDYYYGISNNERTTTELPLMFNNTSSNESAYPYYQWQSQSVSFPADTFVTMPDHTWIVHIPNGTAYYYDASGTMTDDDLHGWGIIQGGGDITHTGGQLAIKDATTLTVSSYYQNGYGDVTYGWKIPATPSGWTNNQQNTEITLSVNMPNNHSVKLGTTLITRTNGIVTAQYDPFVPTPNPIPVHTLGSYQYLRVVFSDDATTTIYGLSAWPDMDGEPKTYASVVVEDTYLTNLNALRIEDSSQTATFRVDSTISYVGDFQTTTNLTWAATDCFPSNESYTFTINSVAFYGDNLSISNGTDTVTLTPDNGSVTFTDVDGVSHTVKVRGMKYSVIQTSNSTWDVKINDWYVLEDLTTAPYFYFGGTWSLTATYSHILETTLSREVWQPGEFAFEKDDFAACGMLVAGICLVGLGMTGPKSGTKIGVLLMICGGAGLIYLNLI